MQNGIKSYSCRLIEGLRSFAPPTISANKNTELCYRTSRENMCWSLGGIRWIFFFFLLDSSDKIHRSKSEMKR